MSTQSLRPWTEVVRLHPDVESGILTEAVFAIDLGAIAEGDPNVPAVNRDPAAFFRATYLTADLRRLLAAARGGPGVAGWPSGLQPCAQTSDALRRRKIPHAGRPAARGALARGAAGLGGPLGRGASACG